MYTLGQEVRVEFWKYPEQKLHYWWLAEVREVREEGVLTFMPIGTEFHHESRRKTVHIDHQGLVAFFPGLWYSGGPDLDEAGNVLEYYWNINTPPNFERERIWMYDLEVDVRCKADHSCEVFDSAELEAKRSVYPAEWVKSALEAVEQAKLHVKGSRWPVLPPAAPGAWLER